MTVGAATVRPEDSIADAARIMIDHHVSGLPVVDGCGNVIGMVSERDLLRRVEMGTEHKRPRWLEMWVSTGELAEEYARAHGRKVADVMTLKVVGINAETPLEEVVSLMERHGFKRLPVLLDGRIAGIVSRANLVHALSRRIGERPPSLDDDLAIRQHILDEVRKQGWSASAIIDVAVSDGIVEINGTVTDERVRHAIAVAAGNAPGVAEVKDDLRVIAFVPTWT